MSPDPYFSVLLPVYNGGRTVVRALESVMAQTEPDWEILAVDDGSSDDSVGLLESAGRKDGRVRLFRIANSGGPARPRNRALSEARGKAVCLLDQDDWWLPEKLECQRPLLDRENVGLVYGDAWIEEEGVDRRLYSSVWGAQKVGHITSSLIETNPIPALTAVIPTAVARRLGGFDERFVGVDDYHLWIRIAMAGCSIEAVPSPVAVYTFGTENLSRDHDLQLESMLGCLSDLARTHPDWRSGLLQRRGQVRLEAFEFYANRLASTGLAAREGFRSMGRLAPLLRSWPEMKRAVKAAIPPGIRPK